MEGTKRRRPVPITGLSRSFINAAVIKAKENKPKSLGPRLLAVKAKKNAPKMAALRLPAKPKAESLAVLLETNDLIFAITGKLYQDLLV